MLRFPIEPLTSSLRRAGVVLLLVVLACSSCRNVPFYRMTSKASQSLPLSREGIAAYERGDLILAEEKLRAAVDLNDCDVETCRYYGETLWKLNKRPEAIKALTSAARKEGAIDAQVSLYRSLGEKSLALNRPEFARVWADKIVGLTPKSSSGWELRGRASRALGRSDEALDDFQRAARFSDDDRELLREIATIQNELGDYDSALATWQCLELHYPTNREPADVFAGKGAAYCGLGLYVDAQAAYEVAVRCAPNEPAYQLRLAETALARGDAARATLALDEALRLAPNDPACRELYLVARNRLQSVASAPDAGANRAR